MNRKRMETVRGVMLGKKGFVLCVCQATCPSLKQMDIFHLLSDVR